MIRQGTKVKWSWGGNIARGKVKKVFHQDVEKTIKGSKVTRHASSDEPAYLIEQEDGDEVLKSASEVERAA